MTDKPLKLIIVDDVKKVVAVLSGRIPWEEHGIRVAATAVNGEDGLHAIRTIKPDIVLTDIRMPRLDGLDMTERALAENPLCKVILLSGYADFDYAQRAIRVGAFDFVAKPFALDEIVAAVMKAKQAWLAEQREMVNRQAMEKRLALSMPALRQEYLNLLLQHRMDEASVQSRWAFLGIDMEVDELAVMVIEIDDFAEKSADWLIQEIELMRFTLQNILEESLSSVTRGIIFRETVNRFVCLFNPAPGCENETLAELFRANVQKYSKFTISIGLGNTVRQLSAISHAYREAIQAVSYHFYAGGNAVFAYENIQTRGERAQSLQIDRDHELFYSFRAGNKEKTLQLLDRMFADVSAGNRLPSPEILAGDFLELAYMLLRVLREKLSDAELEPIERQIRAHRAGGAGSLQLLRQLLETVCAEGCQLIERQRTTESEAVINATMQYVRDNLDKDVSMHNCARLAHLSPSYFSNLFKKVTGQTFSQFVAGVKIERAKQLLLEGVQVQVIASDLGYEDRRYFSEIFKKTTGMTPTEFKLHYVIQTGDGSEPGDG